ncbi:MAG: methyltransferase domain-containing protein [Nitrosarchaeum sp.]|nr:methyltransferase domain-containing protein [Nitrosarchaeum sp.]
MEANEAKTWDLHWKHLRSGRSVFGKLCSIHRILFRARAVRKYLDKTFPDAGLFVEAGSGSSQTSVLIPKRRREIIAVDISAEALKEAKKIPVLDRFVRADIRKLPFTRNSIDGIWNLGVMEHFHPKDIDTILKEFLRVLKPGGMVVLFWPSRIASDKVLLTAIETVHNLLSSRRLQFFPDEVSRLRSKQQGIEILARNGFEQTRVYFPLLDLFTEYVVVARKPY